MAPWQGPDSRADDPHVAPATGAGQRRAESDPGPRPAGGKFEEQPQEFAQALAVVMQKAEVAGAAEALGQDLLEQ
jgi:hypothetical protein